MASRKKKEPLYGCTCNSLAKNAKDFHWSKAYSWYSRLLIEDKPSSHLWTTGLVKVECMPEVVFSVPELVPWCSKCVGATKRIIHVFEASMSPISLSPTIFQKMLRLPNPNEELKLP